MAQLPIHHPRPPHVDTASTTAGKGIKGLFSRRRISSPEPADPSIRSRLKLLIGESNSKASPVRQPPKAPSKRTLEDSKLQSKMGKDSGDTRGRLAKRERKDKTGGRPGSPALAKSNKLKFGPALFPAMQKGGDGKWQPPSLSRGSLSTSALALYAKEVEGDEDGLSSDLIARAAREKDRTRKTSLNFLFQNKVKPEESISRLLSRGHAVDGSTAREDSRLQSTEPLRPETPRVGKPVAVLPATTSRPVKRKSAEMTVDPPLTRNSKSQLGVSAQTNQAAAPSRLDALSKHRPSPPNIHAAAVSSQSSATAEVLSKEHYHLRLATSYLIRVLTPFVRTQGPAVSDRTTDIKRYADEYISALLRLERGWGGDWAKAAGAIGKMDDNSGPSEAKVRALPISERAKSRERQVWVDVLRDGLLLCLYVAMCSLTVHA